MRGREEGGVRITPQHPSPPGSPSTEELHSLVPGVPGVRVVVEGGIVEDHRLLHLAAHWEGIPHHRPLQGVTNIPGVP